MKFIVSFSETHNGFQPLLSDGRKVCVYSSSQEALARYEREVQECKYRKLATVECDPIDEESIDNATFLSVVDFTNPQTLRPIEVSDYYWANK